MAKLEDLNPEQREKTKACKTPGDMLALAKAEDYDLSDEQLEAISGGEKWYEPRCHGHHDCPGVMHPAA